MIILKKMFATLIVFAFLCMCSGHQPFVDDVVFNILETISEGIENSRKIGKYQMFIQWQDKKSRLAECDCHHENMRKYTDDVRKWGPDVFVFPTPENSNIPDYVLDKQNILVDIMKELVDMYSGMNIEFKGDTCCYRFSIKL